MPNKRKGDRNKREPKEKEKTRHATPEQTTRRESDSENKITVLLVLLGPFGPLGLFFVALFLFAAFTLRSGKAKSKTGN